MMTLRKNEINLQFLGVQLIDACPADATPAFQNGFMDFLQEFFLTLDACSMPFANPDGTHDVDLAYVYESTFDGLDFEANKQSQEQRKEYWQGVMAASPLADQALKLAYECPCDSEAA